MKLEISTCSGRFFGLSPKCYCIVDETPQGFGEKTCAKGIQKEKHLPYQEYRDTLYGGKQLYAEVRNFQFKRDSTGVFSVHCQKKLLNHFYTKFRVGADNITLTPLKLDEKYI